MADISAEGTAKHIRNEEEAMKDSHDEGNAINDKQTRKLRSSILIYSAAALLPNIFLFYLFNNNKHQNNLHFGHFVILAFIFSAISILIFLLYRKITKTNEAALGTLLLSWVSFWLFEAIVSITAGTSWYHAVMIQRGVVLVCLTLVTAALLWYLRKHSVAVSKSRSAFLVIAVTICVLFSYNFVPALYSEVLMVSLNSSQGEAYEIKTDFVIDDSLPKPDIYWFHMDEMLGFSAVEKFFGDAQDELKSELLSRGFLINEDAEHRASLTIYAVPSLLSPDFYDSYLGPFYSNHAQILVRELSEALGNRFSLDGIDILYDISSQYELFRAFEAADYSIVALSDFFWSADMVYRDNDAYPLAIIDGTENQEARRNASELRHYNDLIQLLTSTTPLSLFGQVISEYIDEQTEELWVSIPEYGEVVSKFAVRVQPSYAERHLYRTLYDSFSVPSPKLVYIINGIAHHPYIDILHLGDSNRPPLYSTYEFDLFYFQNYKYATEVMLSSIDMVLEENPNAVIILQSDHGIHIPGVHDYMLDLGYTEADVMDIFLSVMSAVRIPQQYGGLDETTDPLNISRLLVNRFVGANYEFRTD